MRAEIITIGDELLIGQIVDTNSAWMADKLNETGWNVVQITSIADRAEAITRALDLALERAEVVLMTGGLGPTKDDVTKKTLATYFNRPLRLDEETLRHVENIFARLGRPMIEMNVRQAEVPEGCTVIKNANGTAPCMWFNVDGKVVVVMPGVPFEMKYLMEEEIIPRLKSTFRLPFIVHENILTAGIGESFLAEQIADIEDSLPSFISLAYLPKLGQVKLRLSGKGEDEAFLLAEMEKYKQRLIQRVDKYVVGTGNITIDEALLQLMKQHGRSLSTAESCTGGYIAHLLTRHAGASAVYVGGGVTYSNALKQKIVGVRKETLEKYTAVSEETIREMVEGSLKTFDTDYAIAVSGYAGPDAGPDQPAGSIWVAVAGKNKTKTRYLQFGNKRQQNIERAAATALTMLFHLVKQDLN